MHVPVCLCARVERGVVCREELGGDVGREVRVDEVVEEECEEDFVDVEGEGREGEVGADGAGEGREEGGGCDEGVEHGGGDSRARDECWREVAGLSSHGEYAIGEGEGQEVEVWGDDS